MSTKTTSRKVGNGWTESRTYRNGRCERIQRHKGGKTHEHKVGHDAFGAFTGPRKK